MFKTTGAYTRADYVRLPEGFPAQLVNGWLVKDEAPTYGHQWLVTRLCRLLADLVPLGHLIAAPTDVAIDEHNVFQPDVVVLRRVPAWESSDVGIPLVAFEVLSKRTARRDRARKTPRLLAAGVEEVWLVDPDAELVEIHHGNGVRIGRGDDRLTSCAVPGFELIPRTFFERPT